MVVIDKIAVQPRNISVDVGITVAFYCTTDKESEWTFLLFGIILVDLPENAFHKKSPLANETMLLIRHAKLENTGLYVCQAEEDGIIYLNYGKLHVNDPERNGNVEQLY